MHIFPNTFHGNSGHTKLTLADIHPDCLASDRTQELTLKNDLIVASSVNKQGNPESQPR